MLKRKKTFAGITSSLTTMVKELEALAMLNTTEMDRINDQISGLQADVDDLKNEREQCRVTAEKIVAIFR